MERRGFIAGILSILGIGATPKIAQSYATPLKLEAYKFEQPKINIEVDLIKFEKDLSNMMENMSIRLIKQDDGSFTVNFNKKDV